MVEIRAPYRTRRPSEHEECVALADWVYAHTGQWPELKLFFSTLNGAHLSGGIAQRAAQMNSLKAAGFLPGVSDYLFLCARGGYFGMALEMKAIGGKLSEGQVVFLELAATAGYYDICAYGADEAIAALEWYLGQPVTKVEKVK